MRDIDDGFERYLKSRGMSAMKRDGRYVESATRFAFEIWNASRSALRERAEPVSWDDMPFTRGQLEGMHGVDFANGYVRGWERKCASVEMKGPLYTAPPAPVVPDELPEFAPANVIKKYFNWADDGDAEVFSMGWNACRAAMLNQK